MRQLRKTTTPAIVGLGALVLLAAPGFAAGDHAATSATAPVQLAHMSQGHGSWGGMMGPGMMGHGYGTGMMGHGYGMAPGMMAPGHGMGPGMMGPGMMGPGIGPRHGTGRGLDPCPGFAMQTPDADKDLSADDVRMGLERSLAWHGNKRLKVGEVKETDGDTIIAEIVTVDGSLVQRLKVDRHSGRMQQVN